MKVREDLREGFSQYAAHFTEFGTAPALIIPTFRISPGLSVMLNDPKENFVRWERDNYVKSISCVAMLVLLAVESLGLVGCYMTGPLLAEKEIGDMINIKKGRNIGAMIPIGYRQW
jgi:nitroreductase